MKRVMMRSKPYLGLVVFALGIMVAARSNAQAAFASVKRSTQTAAATLTSVGTAAMTVSVHKVSDNTLDVTGIHFPDVALPATYVAATDYIQVESTLTLAGSAIQIYTDNKATDANPAFTGNPVNVDPAGLINTGNHALKLPMSWSIKDSVSTTTVVAVNPLGCPAVPAACEWQFFKDRSTVTIPFSGTTAFVDGDQYVTAMQGGTAQFDTASFFPAPSPNFIYVGVDFTTAQTPQTYQTSTVRLELYTQ